ncbi:MAG: 2'-5' RNA ligase family protein [Chitinophagaceae bacterium]
MIQETNPMILTLALEREDLRFFDIQRKKYFPPARNFIDAHLTLFHALPFDEEVLLAITALSNQQVPFVIHVKEPVSLGRGVAFNLESIELMHLHEKLRSQWLEFLSQQDKQKYWPHITVQNKVTLPESQQVLKELQDSFLPFIVTATGLQLWEYMHGPWRFIKEFSFDGHVC